MPSRIDDVLALYTMTARQDGGIWVARYIELPLCYGLGENDVAAKADLVAIARSFAEQLERAGVSLPTPRAHRLLLPSTLEIQVDGVRFGPETSEPVSNTRSLPDPGLRFAPQAA